MELLNVYDNEGNVTERVVPRGDKSVVLGDNEHIGVVVVFIENSKGEFLMQKTSVEKGSEYSSTGGHVDAGETMIQGCKREVFEELGIDVKESEFEFWGEYIADSVWELGQIYKLESNLDINQMKMQIEEVSELKWIPFKDFEKLFYSEDFVPYDKEYKNFIIEKIKNHYNTKIELSEREKI